MDLPAAVALVNTIPELVLAGNSVTLKFQASDNLVETEGIPATITLTWTAAAIAGEYFDLLLAGETVRFTCAAAPDNSGEQFHDNSGSLALAAWVAVVAADLRTNYLIARYYTIIVSGATMIITANEDGDDYSQEFTAGTGIDVTAVETSKTGVMESLRAFYAIAVLLYCDDEFVTEILLNTDDEGYAEADVSKLLEAYLTSAFTFPESGSSLINSHSGNIKTWYFKYGERWGDGEYTAMVQSSTYYVMTGGISWMLLAKYNAASESFWSQLQESKKFLSWAPLTRTIVPDEILKLYFLNHSAATTLTVRAELFTASGSTITTVATINGATDMGVYEFILSPAVIPYSGLTTETLLKFDVWIEDEDSEVVSEVRTYQLDYTHYEHTRYFMFKNSFGVFEVLRTTGLMTTVDDYSRQSASAQVEYDYETDEREEKSIQNIEQQKFKVAAGWLSKFADAAQYRDWLRDFSLSKEVYLVDGEVLKPIELTDTSLDHGKDRDTMATFSFEFINAFTDEFYSKETKIQSLPVSNRKYGALYNWFAVVDPRNITAAGWNIPTLNDFIILYNYIGGASVGYKLMDTSQLYWIEDLPYDYGAPDNSLKFNARGSGIRAQDGLYYYLKEEFYAWLVDVSIDDSNQANVMNVNYGCWIHPQPPEERYAQYFNFGLAIRPMRLATEAEQLLADGMTCDNYICNDGKICSTVKIGTQVWVSENLVETMYRNGDPIPVVTNNTAWAALTTGACCAYDNDWNNVISEDIEPEGIVFNSDFSDAFRKG